MPSPPVSSSSSLTPPPPIPSSPPQGNPKVGRQEDPAKGSRAASTSTLSGQPPSTSINSSGVARTVSTNSLTDVSSSLSSLSVVPPKDPRTKSGKKSPPPATSCSPPLTPRSPPPSPDSAPIASPTPSPPRVTQAIPPVVPIRQKTFLVDDKDKLAAAHLLLLGATVTKVIVNKNSTAVPFIPNGSKADAEKSKFRVTSTDTKYSLVLDGIGEVNETHFFRYFKINDVPATEAVSVRNGTAILKYNTYEEWVQAAEHQWSTGRVWIPAGFDPTQEYDVFYRVCFSCADLNIDNLPQRLKAFFAAYNIEISHAQVTRNENIAMAYIRTDEDWIRYEDLRLEKIVFSLPAFGRDKYPTVLAPIPALTSTNNAKYPSLFIGKVPPGADEFLVRERFRLAATEGGFDPYDVISFGAYRYPGTTKTSRYGYLHVRGKDLADHLIASKVDTSEGTFEVAYAEEKPKSKRQRTN